MAARKTPSLGPRGDKLWSDALRKAVKERIDDGTERGEPKLDRLARVLVDKAIKGDVGAIRELGDRLEGKPAQVVTGEGGGPVTIVVTTGVPRDDC